MKQTSTDGSMQARYTIADGAVVNDPFQMNVIRHQMTRHLDVLTPRIADELRESFDRLWGATTTDSSSAAAEDDWKEFRIWECCLDLIAGASNAAFCGKPLCEYLPTTPTP